MGTPYSFEAGPDAHSSGPLFVPGIGSSAGGAGLSSTPALLSKLGTGSCCLGKGPAELLALHFLSGSWSMAPGFSLPACPVMCRPRARGAPKGRALGCAVPGTVLLLLTYLAYLALGTGVFWMLESPAAKDSSARFQRDKWALLRNFTCLDGPALDSLIRVSGERGRPGRDGDTG